MKKIKVETPKGEADKKTKAEKAAGGCAMVIVGGILIAFIVYALSIFFTV